MGGDLIDRSEPPPGFFVVDAGPSGWSAWEPSSGMQWVRETRDAALSQAWAVWDARECQAHG